MATGKGNWIVITRPKKKWKDVLCSSFVVVVASSAAEALREAQWRSGVPSNPEEYVKPKAERLVFGKEYYV